MYYYKIVAKNINIQTIVSTCQSIDYFRINRMSQLNRLFNLFYELSSETNLSLQDILSLIYPNFNPISKFEIDKNLHSKIEIIKREIITTNFIVQLEFRYFNDFVLDKAREELCRQSDLLLPDRFQSHFFFESLSDCYSYCLELGLNKDKNNKIIEVEFVETILLEKMDNRLVSDFHDYFTSQHFYNQAIAFLTKRNSENPLFEIIFQGKYKVKRLIPMIKI